MMDSRNFLERNLLPLRKKFVKESILEPILPLCTEGFCARGCQMAITKFIDCMRLAVLFFLPSLFLRGLFPKICLRCRFFTPDGSTYFYINLSWQG